MSCSRTKKFCVSCNVLILVILEVFTIQLHAQDPIEHFEFISIKKPKKNKLIYKFKSDSIQSISIDISYKVQSKPNAQTGEGSPGSSDFLQAFFSTAPTSAEVVSNPIGNIQCNNKNLSWEVPLFCPGVMQTVEDTIRGSGLLSYTQMNWKEGAFGFIIEKYDTIGHFDIISNPVSNQEVRALSEVVFSPGASGDALIEEKMITKTQSDYFVDFGVIGELRGEQFVLLFNGEQGQAWSFVAGELRMLFRADTDDNSNTKKRQQFTPFIEWNTYATVTEKNDLLRMAMMSRYLSAILSKGYY